MIIAPRFCFVSKLLVVFSAATLMGCGKPRAGDPAPDLDRLPHVLDMASQWTPDLASVETRLIDFGKPESHVFLGQDWADDGVFENDGSTFSWSLGQGSTVRFTSFEPRRQTLTARLRPYRIDGPPQKVEIQLNDQPVEVLRLKGGMRTYQFKLPANAMIRGTNELTLSNVYPENIGPGPPDLGPPGSAWDYLRFDSGQNIASPVVDGDVVFLPFGAEMRFYAELMDKAVLSLERLVSSHRGGRLDIRLRADGGGELARQMRASTQAQYWDLAAALDFETNQPVLVELSLRAIGGPRAQAGQALQLHWPQLRSAAKVVSARPRPPVSAGKRPAPGAAVAEDQAANAGPRVAEGPNVLVYLVDTLRADHLGCYGYDGETSPRIDAFAADAVVFENAYANSSWTRSTVASLFTGRLPPSHGVYGRKDALSEEVSTLAEVLRQGGYATAAFITNGNAGQQAGLGQGFETFRLLIPKEKSGRAHHALSDTVHRAMVDWLDQPRERPFFLYLHTIDPHAPYAPPRVTARKLAPTLRAPALETGVADELADIRLRVGEQSSKAIKPGSLTWLHALQRGLIEVTDDVISDLVSLYDAEILFNDIYFGKLVDHLKKAGLYDNTILVFVSDHGEEFHDHQDWAHGRTLYQEQLRVPLIVRFPKGPHGLRLRAVAQQIDLLPTLADVLDLPIPDGAQGESLWPLVSGMNGLDVAGQSDSAKPPRVVYSQVKLDNYSAESLVRGHFKLVCTETRPVGCQLFDLAEDPGETVDLAPRRPVLLGYLRQWLRTFEPGDGSLEASLVEEGAEVREHLRALGYL